MNVKILKGAIKYDLIKNWYKEKDATYIFALPSNNQSGRLILTAVVYVWFTSSVISPHPRQECINAFLAGLVPW